MSTDGGLGGLLGDVLVLGIAYKMTDGFGTEKNNQNQQQQQQPKRQVRKQTQTTHQIVAHKKTSHGSRALLQPRTDGDKPF